MPANAWIKGGQDVPLPGHCKLYIYVSCCSLISQKQIKRPSLPRDFHIDRNERVYCNSHHRMRRRDESSIHPSLLSHIFFQVILYSHSLKFSAKCLTPCCHTACRGLISGTDVSRLLSQSKIATFLDSVTHLRVCFFLEARITANSYAQPAEVFPESIYPRGYKGQQSFNIITLR